MSKRIRQFAPVVTPPNGFYTVEPSLHRSLAPLLPEHLPFLKRLELGAIITVSPMPFSETIILFAENEGISTHSIISETSSPFTSSSEAEDWMKIAIELLLALGRDPILLIGSVDTSIDAAVIACVRRLQKWSMSSIIAEFRLLAGRKDFDMEQFVEFFDVHDAVRISRRRMPDYIDIYIRLEEDEMTILEEEQKLMKQIELQDEIEPEKACDAAEGESLAGHLLAEVESGASLECKASGAAPCCTTSKEHVFAEKHSVNLPYTKLLAANPVVCISSHSQYDPNVSLVTEDAVDD